MHAAGKWPHKPTEINFHELVRMIHGYRDWSYQQIAAYIGMDDSSLRHGIARRSWQPKHASGEALIKLYKILYPDAQVPARS